MAVAITTENYDPVKVERIKRLLETQAGKGLARYFEIYVDSLKVVPRTNDLSEFDTFEEFVTEDTHKIRILLYSTSPTSPRNEQYVFNFNQQSQQTPPPVSSAALQGIDIDAKITERVALERERWDNDQQKKELADTKLKLSEAEDYIDKLQTELLQYKDKKLHLGDINLGELASVVMEGIIRRNPQMLTKLPGGEALAGMIEQDNKERQQSLQKPAQETEASFRKKSSAEQSTLTEEEQKYIRVIKQMEEHFEQEQLEKVMMIIESLAEEPSNIDDVASLLNITGKPNDKETDGKAQL